MYDALNTLTAAVPGQAALVLNDLRPILTLGFGMALAVAVIALLKAIFT